MTIERACEILTNEVLANPGNSLFSHRHAVEVIVDAVMTQRAQATLRHARIMKLEATLKHCQDYIKQLEARS